MGDVWWSPKEQRIKSQKTSKQKSLNKQKSTTVYGPSLANNLKEGTHLGTGPFEFSETSLHLNLIVGKAASSLTRFAVSQTEKEDMKNGIPQSQNYPYITCFRKQTYFFSSFFSICITFTCPENEQKFKCKHNFRSSSK